MAVELLVRDKFDAGAWQVSPRASKASPTILLTWTVTPEPDDAGIPPAVAGLFAKALSAIGTVMFGADPDGSAAETIPLRRGLRSHKLTLFRATAPAQILPAFTSSTHDWSMNAQWLVVADADAPVPDDELRALAKRLYEDWTLPEPWPGVVRMIVQAAVDGDGAACHCRDAGVQQEFLAALADAVRDTDATLQLELEL